MAVPCFVILSSDSVSCDDSLRDIQVGMQGLMEASKDPAVLAQLMKDMQVRFYFSKRISISAHD